MEDGRYSHSRYLGTLYVVLFCGVTGVLTNVHLGQVIWSPHLTMKELSERPVGTDLAEWASTHLGKRLRT